MTTPKYNKFNTGRTKGYFPLKRWRFNTEQHPVFQSKERCASSTAKTLFSTQELQMLVGLANTLQCNEREAIRIALYEVSSSAEEAHKGAFKLQPPRLQTKRIRDDLRLSNGSFLNQKRNKQLKKQKNKELPTRNSCVSQSSGCNEEFASAT